MADRINDALSSHRKQYNYIHFADPDDWMACFSCLSFFNQMFNYSISQTQLATVLGIGRSHRYGWVNQTRDPNSETAIAIIKALEEINVDTATEFRRLYLINQFTNSPLFMLNSRFLQALGVVAACFILLQGASWILSSLLRISAGFASWLRYTVVPHTWQIAIAAGVIYLLLNAVFSNRR